MVVQRLSIRAATGKLQVISVWRCLEKNGAKVYRWNIDVDPKTGEESMTVDIVESGPLRTADIAATLGEARLEISVTLFHLSVVSNAGAAHDVENKDARGSTDSSTIARRGPKLTVVRDITPKSHVPGKIDHARDS